MKLIALLSVLLAACGPCNDSNTGDEECPCADVGQRMGDLECRQVCVAERGHPEVCQWRR